MHFFETLVRLHREGEGAPYTGIKPAGTVVEPVIEQADRAIEAGSIDKVVADITGEIEKGIRTRFKHTLETKAHAAHTVDAGRAYVAAYVDFIHYVERIHAAIGGRGHGGGPTEEAHKH
jgi:hypothetical protein